MRYTARSVVDLDPIGADVDAALVVPLHNIVMGELFRGRIARSIGEFRAGFAAPEAEYRFVGMADDEGALKALGVIHLWIDGTNADLLLVHILVHPDSRRKGLGRSILERAVEVAEGTGRSVVMTDTVDTVAAGRAFATAVGAEVGIREHISRVAVGDIEVERLESWMAGGLVRAPDYDLLRWEDGYPDAHLAGIADIFVMADEDMPYEDAPFEPITETADSLRARLEISQAFSQRVTTVAVHRRSGSIVGFSELVRRTSDPSTLFTTLTTVHRDHRGHALGKWLKADVITRAIARFPEARVLQTENAFSNAAMLGINNEIGFVPEYTLTSYQLSTDRIRRYLVS